MKRKARSQRAAGAARARQRIKAHLSWLRGYPLAADEQGLRWRVLGELESEREPATSTLSGRDLSRASKTRRELLGEDPAALEAVVGDLEHWARASGVLLAALAPAVRQRASVPSAQSMVEQTQAARVRRQYDRLRAERPRLAALLDALAFSLALEPKMLARSLRVAEEHADALTQLSAVGPAERRLDLALSLIELVCADGASRVGSLLDLLARRELIDTSFEDDTDLAAMVRKALKGSRQRWPDPEPSANADMLGGLVSWLRRASSKRRRTVLELFGKLGLGDAAAPWTRHHQRRAKLLARARQADALPHAQAREAALEATLAELEALHQKRPCSLILPGLLAMLRESTDLDRRVVAAISEALDAVPVMHRGQPLRMSMFSLWLDHANANVPNARLLELLRAATKLAAARPADELAAIYERYLEGRQVPSHRRYRTIDPHLLALPSGAIAAFYGALAGALERDGVTPWRSANRLQTLATLAELTRDGARAERLYRSLLDGGVLSEDGHIPRVMLTTSMSLRPDDPQSFVELVKALSTARGVQQASDANDGLGLKQAATDARLAAAFRRAVLRGETHLLANLGARLTALRALGAPPKAMALPRFVARDTTWTERYPAGLRPLLAALASVDRNAEASAARLLSKSFPRLDDVAVEINSLRSKIASRKLEPEMRRRLKGRLANLNKRLSGGDSSKPKQLAKLVAKLEALVERQALVAWSERLEQSVASQLLPQLKLERQPSWLLDSPCIDLLPHLLSLPELPSRRLGLRLLRARAGAFPWDLRAEPANAHFIADMTKRGLDMIPWLDGIGVVAEDTPRGRVFLLLERDPLEVLMMGKHFDTCLSPGWFNFFSAVSNAADVNKRVLYVRDEHGTVVGRCLFALDDAGHILTFHPYCHDADGYAMTDITRRYVLRLAEAVGTSPATHGEVSCLLSHDWYDDGPEDIAGTFAPFATGSDLRRWLSTAAPSELASGLRRHLQPLGVNALTLPRLVSLREVAERPELAAPILDEIERIENISTEAMGKATELCWLAGHTERARRFGYERLLPALERRCHPERPPPPASLELLVDVGASSRVLRLIRRSRGRNVRRWSDEADARRLFAAARAHQSLHRRKLAASLYRLVLERRSAVALHTRCRQRLAELGHR